MKCRICHESMRFYYSGVYNRCGVKNYKFSLVKCHSCKLIATDPQPTNEVYPQSRNENNEFMATNTERWNKILLEKVKHFSEKGGDILEIGCNSGDFVQMASEAGYHAMGVEIDEVAAQAGIEKGRSVTYGDVLSMDINKKFDVIVMNHVLEHIPEIEEVPQRVQFLLKEGGVVIVNVPNIHGLIAKIMKQNWCQMAPFTHLWFFSKTSVRKLFGNYFGDIKMKTNTRCEPIGFKPFSIKLWVKTFIVLIATKLNWGDELSIVLRNPASNP